MSENQDPTAEHSDGNSGPMFAGQHDAPQFGRRGQAKEFASQRIQFTGQSSEYFGIWIVNVLLSLATLGIWLPWAKVRRLQYFNGHTRILGDPLEYHATGWMIFKGRLLAFLVLITFGVASQALALVHPVAAVVPILAVFALYPWALNRSLSFSARMTSWRNVRFNWRGTYWGAIKNFFLWPLLGIISVGTCYPLAARAIRHYLANNYRFGTSHFSANSRIMPYYAAMARTVLFYLSPIIIFALAAMVTALIAPSIFADPESVEGAIAGQIMIVAFIPTLVLFFYASLVFTILTRNIIINALKLGNAATFESDLNPVRFIWITFSNLIVSACTFFLMLPWAQVRAYRYQAEGISVIPKVDVPTFVDQEEKHVAAFGEEFAELEGLDVAI